MLSALKGSSRCQRALFQDRGLDGLTSESALNLELATLREERTRLDRRLRALRAALGSELAGVRRWLQSA